MFSNNEIRKNKTELKKEVCNKNADKAQVTIEWLYRLKLSVEKT